MLCKDCKVMPIEYLGTQYRLLVMDVVIKNSKMKRKSVRDPRVRRWNVTAESTTILVGKIKQKGDGSKQNADTM